ncbi:MAG: histidine kinase [Candidatus Symbiothrix sp.]|jgi:ligand-binding sensor domain-containing protein|nr:histidine kinase [Candidatus Symbiothrix sp.]
MKKGIVAFSLLLLSTLVLSAQSLITSEYNYKRYTIPDGLPTNLVETVFQDSRGFMWFGTEHGFVRFDGHVFKKYMPNKSLPINKIEENERGEIVIYGYHFIYLLDVNSDQLREVVNIDKLNYCVGRSPGLPTGYSLYDKRDNKTIGLFQFQNDTLIEVFSHPRLNEMDYGQSLYWDRGAHLYFIPTKDHKVYVVNENGEEKAVYNNLYVCRFVKTKHEVLAVGDEGVWQMTSSGFELKYKFKNKKTSEDDFNVIADADGNLILTTDGSLLRCQDGQLETIIDNVNIPRSLLFDKEGNLWFTSRQGIYNFFKMNLITYKVNAQNADIVYSIVPTGKDEVYIATANGKLIRMGNKGYKELHYPLYQGSLPATFSYQSITIDDAIYFPTFDDILLYKNDKFRWLNLPPTPYYTASCRINDREFAIGGFNSLKIFNNDGSMIREISHFDIGRPTIYTMQADEQGRLWIGGHKGICRISETDSLYFFGENTMNAEASIKDPTGRIWMACESHIYYVSGDSIQLFMEFPNTVIGNIGYTRDNLLVISDNAGIKIIDVQTKRVVTFDYTNGFSAGEPSWNTMAEDHAGNIWLATQSPNIVKFNPAQLLNDNYQPRLYITSSQYSDNNVDMNQLENKASLDYSQRNIRFSFVGLCYSNPENVRYRYRLMGFQDEWSQPVADREVTFNNLLPGNYEFQLMAGMGTPESDTPVMNYTFSIRPAFWQTTWFFILAILVLVVASVGIALYFQRRKNRELLQGLETEKQLNELRIKSIRLKAIPHFNANVLAAIEYYIMNLSKTEAIRLLGIYSRFTFQTLREVDKASRSLSDELEYVQMYLELEKLRFVDKFNYKIEVDQAVDTNVQLPNMILHTYCENAVKHGLSPKKSGGTLQIKVIRIGDLVSVSVEDNGVGREVAAQSRNIHSSKQGLDILSRQIEIYNRFNATKINQKVDDLYIDGQASGTRFTVEVPYNFVYQ